MQSATQGSVFTINCSCTHLTTCTVIVANDIDIYICIMHRQHTSGCHTLTNSPHTTLSTALYSLGLAHTGLMECTADARWVLLQLHYTQLLILDYTDSPSSNSKHNSSTLYTHFGSTPCTSLFLLHQFAHQHTLCCLACWENVSSNLALWLPACKQQVKPWTALMLHRYQATWFRGFDQKPYVQVAPLPYGSIP